MLVLALALGLSACGGDDDDEGGDSGDTTAETQATETTPTETTPTETAPTTTGSTTSPDVENSISRADAAGAVATAAIREAPEDSLYFANNEDVTCEAPEAEQPDNLNERAVTWTCEIDGETNGVTCSGTATVGTEVKGGDPEAVVEEQDITCRQ